MGDVDSMGDMTINVTELWHKQLFLSLMKIQEYIRTARDGYSTIEEMFGISPQDVPQIQFTYLRLITTEMDLLLENTKRKIKETFYTTSKVEVKSAEDLIDNHKDSILTRRYDQLHNVNRYELTPLYYKILDKLKTIRAELVGELTDILYGIKDEDINKKKW